MSRKILIATPAYSGQITVDTIRSVDQAREEGRAQGWDVRFLPLMGSADIADMRNQILGLFLNTPCDDLLCVDADVSWSAGTFAHIMRHSVDFVAGLYRERTDARVVYPARWPDERHMWIDPATGLPLVEATRVPAGFLRLTKACVDRMANAEDVRWVRDDSKLRGMRYPFLFDWTWVKRPDGTDERLSEDYSLCHRWRELGGKVWVDPSLKLNHTGVKTFEGDFMAHLQSEVAASFTSSDPADVAKAALALAGVA